MSQARQPNDPLADGLPIDLHIDLADLLSDLLSQHYNDVVSETGKTIATALPNSLASDTSTSESNTSSNSQLIDRVTQMRNTISRAIEAARQLNCCDLDLPAQDKLLVAVATSCAAKRQLICQLKRDLQYLPDFSEADDLFNNLSISNYNSSNASHIT